MDFARPHICEESVATKSNIRYIPPRALSSNETKTLDDMVIDAANQAAQDLLLGPSTTVPKLEEQHQQEKNDDEMMVATPVGSNSNSDNHWIDARWYPDRISPQSNIIQPHQLVVIFESFDHLNFVYATPHAIFSNRNGHFHHDDFIGKPFGCKVRSRNQCGYGFMYLLKPTPELWSKSLPHRTQIVHELDASMVVYNLNLRPNMIVCESGTGSGALSHFILRTIAPNGHLHTYDFNQHRVRKAREEFSKHGLEHLVTVHYKDVCGKVATGCLSESNPENASGTAPSKNCNTHSNNIGGFDLPGQSVDAIVLDLPNPWLAVPYAAYVLKPARRIATYNPCVEQSQRTIMALQKAGFHSITTQEYRRKEYYVDEVDVEGPPTEKRPRLEPHNVLAYTTDASNDVIHNNNEDCSGNKIIYPGDVDTGAEADNEESQASECEVSLATEDTAGGVEETNALSENTTKLMMMTTTGSAVPSPQIPSAISKPSVTTNALTGPLSASASSSMVASGTSVPVAIQNNNQKMPSSVSEVPQTQQQQQRKRVLVARPFVSMRGHTGFLTFATAGNQPQPYPQPNMQQ